MTKLRKPRSGRSLRRNKPKYDPYDLVLIVCEGEKTEPNYFEELREKLKLNTLNIEIYGEECGSSPSNVVDFALKTYNRKRKHGKIFNRIFCVIDKDTHTTYKQALDRIRRARLPKQSRMEAIPSVPCFEYWLLLHFEYTTRQFPASGKYSVCGNVIGALKKHIPDYEKDYHGILDKTYQYLETAIRNSNAVLKYHKTSGSDNPSTKVHELVLYLKKIKESKKKQRG